MQTRTQANVVSSAKLITNRTGSANILISVLHTQHTNCIQSVCRLECNKANAERCIFIACQRDVTNARLSPKIARWLWPILFGMSVIIRQLMRACREWFCCDNYLRIFRMKRIRYEYSTITNVSNKLFWLYYIFEFNFEFWPAFDSEWIHSWSDWIYR